MANSKRVIRIMSSDAASSDNRHAIGNCGIKGSKEGMLFHLHGSIRDPIDLYRIVLQTEVKNESFFFFNAGCHGDVRCIGSRVFANCPAGPE